MRRITSRVRPTGNERISRRAIPTSPPSRWLDWAEQFNARVQAPDPPNCLVSLSRAGERVSDYTETLARDDE
jgi:hypothetical protein